MKMVYHFINKKSNVIKKKILILRTRLIFKQRYMKRKK